MPPTMLGSEPTAMDRSKNFDSGGGEDSVDGAQPDGDPNFLNVDELAADSFGAAEAGATFEDESDVPARPKRRIKGGAKRSGRSGGDAPGVGLLAGHRGPSSPSGFWGKISLVSAAVLRQIDRATHRDNLPALFLVYIALQVCCYLVWVVMWQGWVTNQQLPTMKAICGAYVFVFIHEFRKIPKYKVRCARLTFTKDAEFDFYNRALDQLSFHGWMVMLPLMVNVAVTLFYTYSFIEGCNYYNVRAPPAAFHANLTTYLSAVPSSSRGCMDGRALNFNPSAVEHESDRCDFVRCHQDVYQFRDDWPIGIKVFAPLYVLIFLAVFTVGLLLSWGHLRYFEGLYMERYKAIPFLKTMWRNAVKSYTEASDRLEEFFSAERLRYANGALIVTQLVLTGAMVVGKLAIKQAWFVEFDLSVLILGFECGRHAPSQQYIAKSVNTYDIYMMTRRLKWHRTSLYHYVVFCAASAYLSVSGGYRIMPGDDWNNQPVLRDLVVNAYGKLSGDDAQIQWMHCPTGLPGDTRTAGAAVISGLFFLLVGLTAWLAIAHYLQYQALKREHSTLLSFASSFKSMLDRRRKRITYAFQDFDASSGELCPPGGYPCHHETLTNKRTRGKLVITNESLVFSKAGGIPELHDITYEVKDLTATKILPGTPPEVEINTTRSSDGLPSKILIASQQARQIMQSVDRVMQAYQQDGDNKGESSSSGGGGNSGTGSADQSAYEAKRQAELAVWRKEREAKMAKKAEERKAAQAARKAEVGAASNGPAAGMDPMQMMMMQQQMMMQSMVANGGAGAANAAEQQAAMLAMMQQQQQMMQNASNDL